MSNRRPAWTLSEAAERTGVSRSTMRRYREQGKLPNAYKDTDGLWRVPLEDLLAVGLTPTDPTLSAPTEQPAEQPTTTDDRLTERVRELESLLAVERARAEGLERIAAAAETNAADLRMALRMLESGRAEPVQEQASAVTSPDRSSNNSGSADVAQRTEPPARKRWWHWAS
ncbi:AlpA family transcriptional regulator [Arthrobacter sp. B1805]|uniref:helix-turn-helix transcriptional regulator n=1 Tax=Arthrobacter sp. B1805 TaxID=2058892 RepID=UPI000CE3C007|nr:helix-turn-helix domain-containing protein [Arthrobacter sp. B1805]